MSPLKFEEFDHTADVGLRVYGASLEGLLANAAEGMFSLIGRAAFAGEEIETRSIEIEFTDLEECLHRWLRALLLEFSLSGFFPTSYALRCASQRLAASLQGGRFDPARHELFTEIKGVTQHALRVRRVDGGFAAEVIFDV